MNLEVFNVENIISFVETFFSAFLGFGSALLVEAISKSKEEKKRKDELIQNLHDELLSVKHILETLDKNKAYISPYILARWKCAKESGELFYLKETVEAAKIIDIFSRIEEANLIEMKCFEILLFRLEEDNKEIIYEVIHETRNKIKEQIMDVILLLERGKATM